MPEGGVSYEDFTREINSLRREFSAELRALDDRLDREVERIEAEMREVGQVIVAAIQDQTRAVEEIKIEIAAGMAAAVVATESIVEKTRQQIASDFDQTRAKIDTQIESTLQIEVGKKIAEAHGTREKITAFVADIRHRFDRAIFTSGQNRELYNVAFRNLTEEFDSKIRSIGAHIFQIRFDDIAPAFKAAAVPYEQAHNLPIEMDLRRLELRSTQLDQTLEILRSSRLDDAASSLDALEQDLSALDTRAPAEAARDDYCVEAVAAKSVSGTTITAGVNARPAANGLAIDLSAPAPGLEVFERAGAALLGDLDAGRPATAEEVSRLRTAAQSLRRKGLISEDAAQLLTAFLAAGGLKWAEA